MTEEEKMLAGLLFNANEATLAARRQEAHTLCRRYNMLDDGDEERKSILRALVPNCGEDVYLQGPIQFDYGTYIELGSKVYANFNFIVLDGARVTVGDNVFFGPNVTLSTPVHPLCFSERNSRANPDGSPIEYSYAKPVVIGSNCWIASGVTVCAGVTIGEGSVIGAGSVVTSDIPPDTLAYGVPCRAVRKITEQDRMNRGI